MNREPCPKCREVFYCDRAVSVGKCVLKFRTCHCGYNFLTGNQAEMIAAKLAELARANCGEVRLRFTRVDVDNLTNTPARFVRVASVG